MEDNDGDPVSAIFACSTASILLLSSNYFSL